MAQVVAAVTVTPDAYTLVEADTLRFSAAAADANGHAVEAAQFTHMVVGLHAGGRRRRLRSRDRNRHRGHYRRAAGPDGPCLDIVAEEVLVADD